MKYATLYLIALVAVAAISCQDRISNNTSAKTIDTAPTVTPSNMATPDLSETGCKICKFDYSSYKGELKKQEIDGLLLALNDEYLATATYEQVNRDFGNPRPFVNIVNAEMTHADLLKALLTKYGIAVPPNTWIGEVPKYASVTEACAAGVKGEILNRDLYTQLFKTTERKDIISVYEALQRASEQNHLPAFQRCGGGRGPGAGGQRGYGPGRRGNE